MIQVRISPAQRRRLEGEMKQFAKRAGVAVGETVAIIGSSVAKELARKVQPFGLSEEVGEKFMKSIMAQVHRSVRWAIFKGTEGTVSQVHGMYRNSRGAVIVRPPRQFQPKRKTLDWIDVDEHLALKQQNAGIAKAGWIAAGENIDSPLLRTAKNKVRQIKGVAKWIRRHVKASKGSSRFVRKGGLNSTVYLTNKVDYAYSKRNSNRGQVDSSIADGYKRSITMAKRIFRNLK
jgi:hypothetical protein